MTGINAAEKFNDRLGFGRCTCGKVRFKTRKAAKGAIRRMSASGKSGRLAVYRCGDWFHVGHQPSIITRGEIDRAEFDPNLRRRRNDGGKP